MSMDIDESGNLWNYYIGYTFIQTDFRTETEYDPKVEGTSSFAIAWNDGLADMENQSIGSFFLVAFLPICYTFKSNEGDKLRRRERICLTLLE